MKRLNIVLIPLALTSLGALSLVACGSSSDSKGATGGTGGTGTGGTGKGGTGTGGTGTGGNPTGGAGGSGGSAGAGASGGSGGAAGAPASVECPKTGPKPLVNKGPGVLSADETWTADNVYEVFGQLGTDNHTLNIEAGTVVCFTPTGTDPNGVIHGKLSVDAGGTLNVKGTAAAHVVFTRDKDYSSDWDGFVYDGTVTNPGSVEYADLYWTGSSGGGSITTGNNKNGAKLDWRNVTFYQFQRAGFINLMGGWTPETSITIHEYGTVSGDTQPPSYYANEPVLRMRPETMHTITPTTLSVPDSAPDPVKYVTVDHAEGEDLTESFEFPKLPSNLSYYVGVGMKLAGDTTAPNTWTIDAGARIAVAPGAHIQVGNGTSMSHIIAVGTATDPIVFTSASMHTAAKAPAPGDWPTMVFFKDAFDPAVTKFDYVHFEYGGDPGSITLNSCDQNAYGGFVGFDLGFGGSAPGFSITHSVFEHSSGQAIRSNGNPPNLSTDYTAAALGNQFNGFTNPPAQYIGSCP